MPQYVEFDPDPLLQLYDDSPVATGGKGKLFVSLDGHWIFKQLYHDLSDLKQKIRLDAIRDIVSRHSTVEASGLSGLFAWPDRMAIRANGINCTGVRMAYFPLRTLTANLQLFHVRYESLPASERGSWLTRLIIAIKLTRAIGYLETLDVIHSDISPNNVLVDHSRGTTILIDCDSCVASASPHYIQIIGTPGYMAPELVSGEERFPNRYSDRHALAVLVYQLLLYLHPLKGPKRHPDLGNRAIDSDEEEKYLLGGGALYIEDPVDSSNHMHGQLIRAHTLGQQVATLFRRAFVDGLHRPQNRPSPEEWEVALTRLYSRVVPCSNTMCQQQFYVAPEIPGQIACTLCEQQLVGPKSLPYLRVSGVIEDENGAYGHSNGDGHTIVGWPGRPIHAWNFLKYATSHLWYQSSHAVAPLMRFEYETSRDRWYVRNISCERLVEAGHSRKVAIGDSVRLTSGQSFGIELYGYRCTASVQLNRKIQAGRIVALPLEEATTGALWPTLTANQSHSS